MQESLRHWKGKSLFLKSQSCSLHEGLEHVHVTSYIYILGGLLAPLFLSVHPNSWSLSCIMWSQCFVEGTQEENEFFFFLHSLLPEAMIRRVSHLILTVNLCTEVQIIYSQTLPLYIFTSDNDVLMPYLCETQTYTIHFTCTCRKTQQHMMEYTLVFKD